MPVFVSWLLTIRCCKFGHLGLENEHLVWDVLQKSAVHRTCHSDYSVRAPRVCLRDAAFRSTRASLASCSRSLARIHGDDTQNCDAVKGRGQSRLCSVVSLRLYAYLEAKVSLQGQTIINIIPEASPLQ